MTFEITLEMVMRQNPRISLPEAFQKLQALKLAATLNPLAGAVPATSDSSPSIAPDDASSRSGIPRTDEGAKSTLPARELMVTGVPKHIAAAQIQQFLGQMMGYLQLTRMPGNAVQSVWVSQSTKFAMAEFRTVEEACTALNLGNVSYKGHVIRLVRPSKYTDGEVEAAAAAEGIADLSAMLESTAAAGVPAPPPPPSAATAAPATAVPAAAAAAAESHLPSSVVMIMNLPKALVEEQVKELLSPFGEHARFNLMVDEKGASKGTAVCEFLEASCAGAALKGLDGMSLGSARLMAQCVPQAMADTLLKKVVPRPQAQSESRGEMAASPMPTPAPAPTRVVMLTNMLDVKDLVDDAEYKDIVEDVNLECSQYGVVKSVVVPRPPAEAGVGKIFVEYEELPGAASALAALAGRTFAGKQVKASFYPLADFEGGMYAPPPPAPEASGGSGGSQQAASNGHESSNGDSPPDFDNMDMEEFVPEVASTSAGATAAASDADDDVD
jgi:splicing factor U2AF subunit